MAHRRAFYFHLICQAAQQHGCLVGRRGGSTDHRDSRSMASFGCWVFSLGGVFWMQQVVNVDLFYIELEDSGSNIKFRLHAFNNNDNNNNNNNSKWFIFGGYIYNSN